MDLKDSTDLQHFILNGRTENGNNNYFHVQHALLYISLPSLHDFNVNFLISRFMENVNTRQRFYFSFSELRYSLLQFQSRRIRQNMTNWTNWNKKEEVCNSTFLPLSSSYNWSSLLSSFKPREAGYESVYYGINNSKPIQSVLTWRRGCHIGVLKQWNGGHVGVPNQSGGRWILFLCKRFLLFQ